MRDLIKISASLMCSDLMNLEQEVINLQNAGCDAFHLDLIDGNFAENFGLNFDAIKAIKTIANIPIEVHLMVLKPERYIEILCEMNVDCIILHPEACQDLDFSLTKIKSCGIKTGVAISSLLAFFPDKQLLKHIDYFLFLTVKTGFTGQKFIRSVVEKINKTAIYLKEMGYEHIVIQADGHINAQTIPILHQVGVTRFVGGSSGLFCGNRDYKENIFQLKHCIYENELI